MKTAFSVPIYNLSESSSELPIPIGEGAKGMIILIPVEDLSKYGAFLSKILGAIHFDIAKDVRIFPITADDAIAWSNLQSYTPWSYLWVAGEKQLSVNMDKQPYRWVSIQQKHIIFTHTIAQIESNASYKKLLWDALKEKFIE